MKSEIIELLEAKERLGRKSSRSYRAPFPKCTILYLDSYELCCAIRRMLSEQVLTTTNERKKMLVRVSEIDNATSFGKAAMTTCNHC